MVDRSVKSISAVVFALSLGIAMLGVYGYTLPHKSGAASIDNPANEIESNYSSLHDILESHRSGKGALPQRNQKLGSFSRDMLNCGRGGNSQRFDEYGRNRLSASPVPPPFLAIPAKFGFLLRRPEESIAIQRIVAFLPPSRSPPAYRIL